MPDPTAGRRHTRSGTSGGGSGGKTENGIEMDSRQGDREVGGRDVDPASSDAAMLETQRGQGSELDGLAEEEVDEVIVELERRLCGLLGCR